MSWILIIAIILVIVFLVMFFHMRKVPKLGCLALITGGVKTGKSTLAIYLAIRQNKRQRFKWKLYMLLQKVLTFLPVREEPLLYSNVPLAGVNYVPLTVELLLREKRFNYRSTIYVQEASLVEDSQMFKDMDINERLLYFNKLIGHETRGGGIIYDTQAIQDCHYAIKRSISSYIWIHHNVKIPFFIMVYVREMFYSEDNSSVNVFNEDVEKTLLRIIVPKSVWKKFDAYCYSKLTDDLEREYETVYIPKRKFSMSLENKRAINRKLRTDRILSVRKAIKERKERHD